MFEIFKEPISDQNNLLLKVKTVENGKKIFKLM